MPDDPETGGGIGSPAAPEAEKKRVPKKYRIQRNGTRTYKLNKPGTKKQRKSPAAKARGQRRATATSARSPGAITSYRKEFDEQVRTLCLLGMTDEQIAECFGVSTRTIDNWKSRFPTFLVSMRAGKVLADAQVVDSLHKRALGYKSRAVKIHIPEGAKSADDAIIVPYTKEHAPDVNAAKFWLMNRQRDNWKERQEITAPDSLSSMSPEQRLAQVVEIMAKARALLAAPDPEDGDGEAEITDAEYEEVEDGEEA